MTIKKLLYLSIGIILMLSLAIIVYAKINFKKFDYNLYIKNSPYNFISSINDQSNAWNDSNMNYEEMFHLQDFFIDEKIFDFDDLINLSKYILIVSNEELPTYKGNGVINNCTIKKVIKGKDLNVDDKIKIYDLIFHWDIVRTFYLNGNTPLKIGDEYIVFLRKTERASVPDTFVFNNVKFGRVSLLEKRSVLENYEQGTMKVEEILDYDFVFPSNSNIEIKKYKKMIEEIRKYAKIERS